MIAKMSFSVSVSNDIRFLQRDDLMSDFAHIQCSPYVMSGSAPYSRSKRTSLVDPLSIAYLLCYL